MFLMASEPSPPFVPSEVEGPSLSAEGASTALGTNGIRGRLTNDAPLAPLVWFKSGGAAQTLFEPADVDDLRAFLRDLDPATPVLPLGLGSNLIIRDGGWPGVVVRLGKAFAKVERIDETTLRCGGGASGILVSSTARDAGIAGLEFMRSIPGTVGGFVRMNGGAYGREVKDVLIEAEIVLRSGEIQKLPVAALGYTYRHSELPEGAIVTGAVFRGTAGEPAAIQAEMDRIAAAREASQPLRSKTGGSTFKNPPGERAWALVDAAGCRGLKIGGAQVSEKHTNFLINTGDATSTDIEALGEEVRARVKAHSGVDLEWEIQRVGFAPIEERIHANARSRGGDGDTGGMALEEVARIVVDAAYHLHREIGPGLLENAYELLLSRSLVKAGLRVERQKSITVNYDGMTIADAFRIDLLVNEALVVELKSVEMLAKVHSKQLLTYLRLTRQPLGLLINFGSSHFTDGVKRVVNGHKDFAASRLRVNQKAAAQREGDGE